MSYKILSQGVMDGACFLYSIMNAYKTLTYPELNVGEFINLKPKEKSGRCKWEYIVNTCPQTLDMLSGHGFYTYISSIQTHNVGRVISNQFKNTIKTAFDILSDQYYQFSVSNICLNDIKNFDFKQSVIIMPIGKKIETYRGNGIANHFICINGKKENDLEIMCSYCIHLLPEGKYFESFNDINNRYYNNIISLDDVTEDVVGEGINSIYKITKL